MDYDLIIRNGRYFDGTGVPSRIVNVAVKDGRIARVSADPINQLGCKQVIDAEGKWVMPGFLDTHTHYDAELLAAPGLKESVRHGVTTVTVGSCSISMMLNPPEDCADLFTRVEAVPREHVLPLLQKKKDWHTPAEYIERMNDLPLGPNVTAYLGHSELRSFVMGLDRALDRKVRPSEGELVHMAKLLEAGLDAGLLGLSSMTTMWDKLDGNRYRSASLPSTYAHWREFRYLNQVLRRRGRIHQGAPNIVTKYNMLLYLGQSLGIFRKRLKTTLITLMDVKSNGLLHRVVGKLAHFCNLFLRGNFRWQALPCAFEVYSDGVDLVIFEEFGAGEAALHLKDELERKRLFADPAYREWFRKDYAKKFSPRVWHRDFHDTEIVSCEDESLVGKSIGQVADERGIHPVDAFLDLVIEHGKSIRWKTLIGNWRRHRLEKIIQDKGAIISFSDAGAHLRNMAFYNFPLRMLALVHEANQQGRGFMSIEKAVWRLTGELAEWFDIDAGRIRVGDRADIAIVDPDFLNFDELSAYHEAPIPEFGGMQRMVNRNDSAVAATLINGRIAWIDGDYDAALGQQGGYGHFLRAGEYGATAKQPLPASLPRAA